MWSSHSSSPKLGTPHPPPHSGKSRRLEKRALRSRQIWMCKMVEGIEWVGVEEGCKMVEDIGQAVVLKVDMMG